MASLGNCKTVELGFDDTRRRTVAALEAEGFGVLTEIDVDRVLSKRLGVEVPRYSILGACLPSFAHRALTLEPDAGLAMPCNVVVREDDPERTTVVVVDPTRTAALLGGPALAELAAEVKEKLVRALERIAA